ncbi:oxidoreductase [Xylaria acuta]|nr:oxidoreductase [Xylaria acuta]
MPSLDDKVIFVTGGTVGLGAIMVERIAKKGPAHIYFSGRKRALHLSLRSMDMASLSSVSEALSQTFKSSRLDILICNAGVMVVPCDLSKDGYEIQFAVKFMAHALIIQKLLPTMTHIADLSRSDVRIVLLTSVGWRAHPPRAIAFDIVKTVQPFGVLGPWRRHGQSKVAAVLYAAELARRYPQITTVSVHPGVVATGLNLDTADETSLNGMWAASSDKTKMKNGNWYLPGRVDGEKKLDSDASKPEVAGKLWKWTDEALKLC